MRFPRFPYLVLTLWALCCFSRMVPAQPPQLPSLPVDPRIQRGTLGSGVTYYMVTDPSVKGYADVAIVQRDEPLSAAKREGLDSDFLGRMAIAPGPEGFLTDVDGSTVYRFSRVPFYRPEVLDSTLLYSFSLVARSKAQQAVIVSGDIDAPELKKKMDIFSMLVPRMLVKENHRPDYVWEPSPAPSVQFHPGDQARVSVSYSCARTPFAYMNTAQALVTDLFGSEFEVLLRHRLERDLREAGIPYTDMRFDALRSGDYGGDERYTVSIQVARDQLHAAMRVLSSTLAQMEAFGVKTDEFVEAKQVLMPRIHEKAASAPAPGELVSRCIAHFLYGANLAPYSETVRLFSRKNLPDSTETRLFNNFADALLEQLTNLELEYTQAPDSLDKDHELFYYNLSYLYGSVIDSGNDYSWHGSDTLGLNVTCPKVKIKSEKKEAVSGGTLWTFSNGMRVVYKEVPGNRIFHYALQLNGGLAQIEGLVEGEGGYAGDMLSLFDAGGLPAARFRDILEANGIRMDTKVDLHNLTIEGSAPSTQFVLLLKLLLALSNNREPNPAEFEAYRQRELLRAPDRKARLMAQLAPGYIYTTSKYPQALSPDSWKKFDQYYADRFCRMNDGVLILSGDLGTEVVKKMLCRYLGGFRVLKGTVPRKAVTYSPRSGTVSMQGEGPDKGIHILMDAGYALTADHVYTAQVGVEALQRFLAQGMAGYGFSCEVNLSLTAHPQERFQLWLHCTPIPLPGLPADVTEVSAQRALTAVRAVIQEAATKPVEAKDLALWKSKLSGEVKGQLASPSGFVATLLARYAWNKDLTSRYQESIQAITADQVKGFLSALAEGGRVECIVP